MSDDAGSLVCVEPAMQYLHVRIMKAVMRPGDADKEGPAQLARAPRWTPLGHRKEDVPGHQRDEKIRKDLYVSVKLGDMKETTTVKPVVGNTIEWEEDLIVGMLKPVPGDSVQVSPTSLTVRLKQFCPLKRNSVIGSMDLPLSTIPYIDTLMDPTACPLDVSLPHGDDCIKKHGEDPRKDSPTIHLKAWFEKAYEERAQGPVIGTVSVILDTIKLFAVKGRHTRDPYAVISYGKHWIRLPTSHGSQCLSYVRKFTFDVHDPSSLLMVAIFDEADTSLIGSMRIRVSTLPANRSYESAQPLHVRRDSQVGVQSSMPMMGEARLRLCWSHNQDLQYFKSYCEQLPCSPPLIMFPKLAKAQPTLIKQHNALVMRYLKASPLSLPEIASQTLLAERLMDFNISMFRAHSRRFSDSLVVIGDVLTFLGNVCEWKSAPTSIFANLWWLLAVYLPLIAFHVVLVFLLWYMSGHWFKQDLCINDNITMEPKLFEEWTDSEAEEDSNSGSGGMDSDPAGNSRVKSGFRKVGKFSKNPLRKLSYEVDSVAEGGLKIQDSISRVATVVERTVALLQWSDSSISGLFYVFVVAIVVSTFFLPFLVQPLVAALGLFVLRHPRFRDPLPSSLLNVLLRLPTRVDRVLPPLPKGYGKNKSSLKKMGKVGKIPILL